MNLSHLSLYCAVEPVVVCLYVSIETVCGTMHTVYKKIKKEREKKTVNEQYCMLSLILCIL